VSGLLDTVRVDVGKRAGMVAALYEKVPDIGEVVRKWASPANEEGFQSRGWNSVYQGLQEEAGAINLGNQSGDDGQFVYSLAALQGSFMNFAVTGKKVQCIM
jgi:hypothetical protein